MSVPDRSPVCPKALTLSELKELPRGTELVLFWGKLGERQRVSYEGRVEQEEGHIRVALREAGGIVSRPYATDVGLLPSSSSASGWNPYNVLVLPQDVDALPPRVTSSPDPGPIIRN
jgi:hypothetical protein